MSIEKNNHLREVLDTHKMCHVQDLVDKVKQRREEIKEKMHNHYGNNKYSSFGSGSFAKHTAINTCFPQRGDPNRGSGFQADGIQQQHNLLVVIRA